VRKQDERLGWAGVELRHLLALKAVAEVGSLAGAARHLGYSQPAISQQLAALERLVGLRLVERRAGGRSVRLTEAGERTLGHAEAILVRARAAEADLGALERGVVGNIRLGTIPSVGARIVPDLLRRFARRVPDIDVQLVEDGWDDALWSRLESGALDLTFASPPLPERPFEFVELLDDPYVLLVASDSPLAAAKRPLSLDALADVPLIVCSQSADAEEFCRSHGVLTQIRYRIEDNETLVGLAAAGRGAALLPRLAVDLARLDVVQVELEKAPPPRTVALMWHRDREPSLSMRLLVSVAHEVCAEIERAAA
jgi:molybdate transport repressor ModE-like protein